MKKLSLIFILIAIVSCRSVEVNTLRQQTTKTVVELGVIGKVKKGIKLNTFQTTTVPVYKQKIRVAASIVAFTDNSFNTYAKAAMHQNKKVKESYIDSLTVKPGYANLQIMDNVQLLSELNGTHNKEINTYLQITKKTKIITSISAYFSPIELSNISQAEELYLVNSKTKKYILELMKSGKIIGTIDLSRAVTFAYTTASFCWGKEHGTVYIANLVGKDELCTRKTYRNVTRLNKKVNYYKY